MEKVRKYRLIDGERFDTGETYVRNAEWNKGEENCYIVGINNWIVNSEGKFLMQKRALTKRNNPGKWSSTNGLMQPEESDIEAVQRETREELGIEIKPEEITLVNKNYVVGNHLIVDIFVTKTDVSLKDITIQESEVDEVKFVSPEELESIDISTTCSYIKDLAQEICKKAFKKK